MNKRKEILLAVFVIICVLPTMSQNDAHSIATIVAMDGKEWRIMTRISGGAEEDYLDGRYTKTVRMWIEGDTIVDDVACKKLYKHTKPLWDGGKEQFEVGYCHQDGDRYYQNGELMFDFSLQVGDVFVPIKEIPLTVKSIGDTILADGVTRKYLLMVEDMNAEVTPYNSDYWVEGIGSLRMGIYTNDFSSAGLMKTLQSCAYNGNAIYRNTPYLVSEGKQWAICSTALRGQEIAYWTNTYRLEGDTIINEKTYKIEHESCREDLSDMKPSGRYMREENGKVYSITDKDQRDCLVFDYTMQIGDTLRYNPVIYSNGDVASGFEYLRLIAVRDTVMPNGDAQVRKCYDVEVGWCDNGIYSPYSDDCNNTFIEDIGSVSRGLSDPVIGAVGTGYSLLYVKQDDVMLYQLQEGLLWKDNTGIDTVEKGEADSPYHDLQGRPVANPTRGIYIKDGKKVAIK